MVEGRVQQYHNKVTPWSARAVQLLAFHFGHIPYHTLITPSHPATYNLQPWLLGAVHSVIDRHFPPLYFSQFPVIPHKDKKAIATGYCSTVGRATPLFIPTLTLEISVVSMVPWYDSNSVQEQFLRHMVEQSQTIYRENLAKKKYYLAKKKRYLVCIYLATCYEVYGQILANVFLATASTEMLPASIVINSNSVLRSMSCFVLHWRRPHNGSVLR